MNKKRGIWFFGLSGSGKSFASILLQKKIKNSIIIDGDDVRKYISFDLSYSKDDRNIQLKRMLGIGKIAIKSGIFPLISTVWMNKNIMNEAKKNGIQLLKIETDFDQLLVEHETYQNKKDVVGVNFKYSRYLKPKIIKNNKDAKFWTTLKKLTL